MSEKKSGKQLLIDIIRLAGETDQNAPLLVEVNNPIMLKELALDLYKRLDVATKALEWYADENHYTNKFIGWDAYDFDVVNDDGERARQALKGSD